MPDLAVVRAEIERMRVQVGRQRREMLQLQRAGMINSLPAEALLARMLAAIDLLCAERDRPRRQSWASRTGPGKPIPTLMMARSCSVLPSPLQSALWQNAAPTQQRTRIRSSPGAVEVRRPCSLSVQMTARVSYPLVVPVPFHQERCLASSRLWA